MFVKLTQSTSSRTVLNVVCCMFARISWIAIFSLQYLLANVSFRAVGDNDARLLCCMILECEASMYAGWFSQVKDIHLCSEQFTVENGLLTPTLKSKRPALRRRFAAEIQNMYNTNHPWWRGVIPQWISSSVFLSCKNSVFYALLCFCSRCHCRFSPISCD